MASTQLRLVGGAAAIFLCAFVFASTSGSRAQQLNSGTPDVLRIRLGYVKGLSRSFTAMVGEMAVDLGSGAFELRLTGLRPRVTYSLWLVDRTEGDAIQPVPDTVFRVATILAKGSSTRLTGVLGLNLPPGFTIDRVVVSPGTVCCAEAFAAGTVNVFQKIFFRRLSLANESTGARALETTRAPRALLATSPSTRRPWSKPPIRRPSFTTT